MPRYLLFFSYIGTRFRGSQRQWTLDKKLDLLSIQGLIEHALKVIWYEQQPQIKLSSRTDAGVHAFMNTAHFDTDLCLPQCSIEPNEITMTLNKTLRNDDNRDISILRTCIVPESFHSRRSVRSRSYMYRLAVVKDGIDTLHCRNFRYQSLLPMVEQLRCHIVGPQFNIDAFCATMNLFRGFHDFTKFMATPSKCPAHVSPLKSLDLQVVPGQPFLNSSYDPLYENVDFFEVHLHSRSFLYRQIRRMIGAGIDVGRGRLHIDEVRYMLENPLAGSCVKAINGAPAYGLFLTKVMYDALDLEFSKDKSLDDSQQLNQDSS